MGWTLLTAVVLVLLLVVAASSLRRLELQRLTRSLQEREVARARGSDKARLQYPHVDLTRCIGCGTCVTECPEDGVLDIVHGQAVVVHGARCVGHGRCATACPVGAIALTLADLANRRDLPVLDEQFEAKRVPGLFLAGEVTGYALVATAIAHGRAVADTVADRLRLQRPSRVPLPQAEHDLVIVGAGPAGLACALGAKARGLRYLVIEQEELGGTVAKYPRSKLVMTQPVELPIVGRLRRSTYSREELLELWRRIVDEQQLPLRTKVTLQRIEQRPQGGFVLHTSSGPLAARFACIAVGRRGTPRKLGVPGEELSKVCYSLLDARSFEDRNVLVVGGGDSAVEAALGLAEQPGNRVTVSYRKSAFTRLKTRNERAIHAALAEQRITVLFDSEVRRITSDRVELEHAPAGRRPEFLALPNDDVFVFAGGTPPTELLESAGVSFDPKDRAPAAVALERGTGLLVASVYALGLSLLALGWVLLQQGYYKSGAGDRVVASAHDWLRPAGGFGLLFGAVAVGLLAVNLAYLVRRSCLGSWLRGSLRAWMNVHLVTGILALLFALLHGGLLLRPTVGGHALLGLAVLVVTGAIGRFVYSLVPRAANGRELVLDEVRAEVASVSGELDREGRGFSAAVHAELAQIVSSSRCDGSRLQRLLGFAHRRSALRQAIARLSAAGRAADVPPSDLHAVLGLLRRSARLGAAIAYFEDLRGLLASWRYFHRWVALLIVALVVLHVATAVRYAEIAWWPESSAAGVPR